MGGCSGKPGVEVQPVSSVENGRKTNQSSLKIVVSAETGERQCETRNDEEEVQVVAQSPWDIDNYDLLSIIGKIDKLLFMCIFKAF